MSEIYARKKQIILLQTEIEKHDSLSKIDARKKQIILFSNHF